MPALLIAGLVSPHVVHVALALALGPSTFWAPSASCCACGRWRFRRHSFWRTRPASPLFCGPAAAPQTFGIGMPVDVHERAHRGGSDMLTRIIVLIEDDWELFGNGLGNVADVQYLPLLFLLRLADQLGLKITFMAEVMQQLAMRGGRVGSGRNAIAQAGLWDECVRMMKERGHDVQLHLHPQWLDAELTSHTVRVGPQWNIAQSARRSAPDDRRRSSVPRGVDPAYRPFVCGKGLQARIVGTATVRRHSVRPGFRRNSCRDRQRPGNRYEQTSMQPTPSWIGPAALIHVTRMSCGFPQGSARSWSFPSPITASPPVGWWRRSCVGSCRRDERPVQVACTIKRRRRSRLPGGRPWGAGCEREGITPAAGGRPKSGRRKRRISGAEAGDRSDHEPLCRVGQSESSARDSKPYQGLRGQLEAHI